MLRKTLEQYKDQQDTVLLFTDGYDVIFQNNKDQILKMFDTIGSRIVLKIKMIKKNLIFNLKLTT